MYELHHLQAPVESFALFGLELDNASLGSENGVIFAHQHTLSWMELGATLADDNTADFGGFPAEEFHAQAL